MEDNLKKRLLGAFVIIFALVLVLPNLLDGDHRKNKLLSEIPQEPKKPDWVQEKDVKKVKVSLEKLKSGELEAMIKAPNPKEIVQSKEKVAGIASDRVGLDSNNTAVSWVLKVGAFKQHKNAYALRNKLRKNGFTAYTLKGDAADLERVYVGPMLQRAEAEKVVGQLKAKLAINEVVIQRYRPE